MIKNRNYLFLLLAIPLLFAVQQSMFGGLEIYYQNAVSLSVFVVAMTAIAIWGSFRLQIVVSCLLSLVPLLFCNQTIYFYLCCFPLLVLSWKEQLFLREPGIKAQKTKHETGALFFSWIFDLCLLGVAAYIVVSFVKYGKGTNALRQLQSSAGILMLLVCCVCVFCLLREKRVKAGKEEKRRSASLVGHFCVLLALDLIVYLIGDFYVGANILFWLLPTVLFWSVWLNENQALRRVIFAAFQPIA